MRTKFSDIVPGSDLISSTDNDLIPVVDAAIGHLIGYKDRRTVHSEGDFHIGIQAYVVRINEQGQTEVLVQKRSGIVDISKGQFDQSLATQILAKDGGALRGALIRGLREELEVREDEIEIAPCGLQAELKVYKKYSDDPDLYNREFICLNFVRVKRKDIQSKNPKVDHLLWMTWSDYISHMRAHPENFTKTAWFYVMNPDILRQTEQELDRFFKNDPTQQPLATPLKKAYFYSYPGRYDITISILKDNRTYMHVYDHKTRKVTEVKNVQSIDPCEGKNQQNVTFYVTKKNGTNFLWEDGVMRRLNREADLHSKRCLKKMVSKIEKDITRLEAQAQSDEDMKLTWALRKKFNYIFEALRSRVLSGEMLFFECLPTYENGDFGINNYPDNISIITIPGTFDPPHFAHIELMFDAMIYESEIAHGKKTAYALFFTPVGDYAPGPSGLTWKSQKTESEIRHEMCAKVSDIFYPLMQTSRISLSHPEEFGTKNAIAILKALKNRVLVSQVRFIIAIGTDTYRQWGKNIGMVIEKEKNNYPGVEFTILIRESWNDPLEESLSGNLPINVKLLKGVYSLPVRSTHVRVGQINLIPSVVQYYAKHKKLYSSLASFSEKSLAKFSPKDKT